MGNKKFKVGDRVRVIQVSLHDINTNLKIGDVGVIKVCEDTNAVVLVDFGKNFKTNGINYNLKKPGYAMYKDQLELANDEKIIIYRDGNKVIALDKTTGKKGIAKCNPLDTFDFNIGAKLAFERLTNDEILKKYDSTIRVGDTVEIVNKGKSYTTYDEWVTKHVANKKDICHYHYDIVPSNGMIGEVLHVAKHGDGNTTLAYVRISNQYCYKCYLIAVEGLKKV